jgi:hypothetical protein
MQQEPCQVHLGTQTATRSNYHAKSTLARKLLHSRDRANHIGRRPEGIVKKKRIFICLFTIWLFVKQFFNFSFFCFFCFKLLTDDGF